MVNLLLWEGALSLSIVGSSGNLLECLILLHCRVQTCCVISSSTGHRHIKLVGCVRLRFLDILNKIRIYFPLRSFKLMLCLKLLLVSHLLLFHLLLLQPSLLVIELKLFFLLLLNLFTVDLDIRIHCMFMRYHLLNSLLDSLRIASHLCCLTLACLRVVVWIINFRKRYAVLILSNLLYNTHG